MPECGAKRSNGQVCRSTILGAGGRCRAHGGASLGGKASPKYRTGRYSKYLPPRMLAAYRKAVRNPALLSLTDEVAAVEARIVDLLPRVDTGEAGQVWQELRGILSNLRVARSAGDTAEMARLLNQMERLIGQGAEDYRIWGELVGLFDHKRRLVESERKRMVEMRQVVALDQIMIFVDALTDELRRQVTKNVADQKKARAILSGVSYAIGKLLDYRPRTDGLESDDSGGPEEPTAH